MTPSSSSTSPRAARAEQDPQQAAQPGTAGGQPGTADGQPGTADGRAGMGGGSIGSLDDAALTELLLAALRDGNDVMLRAIAAMFVDRHAAIEPGRPVAGTYYVFRTLRAVDPDRLLARLVEGGEQAGNDTGLLRRLQLEGYEAQVQRFRLAVEAEVRRRLVDDRGASAVARTLRRPLPEDVDFLTSSREQIVAMRSVIDPLTRLLAGRLSRQAAPPPARCAGFPAHDTRVAELRGSAGGAGVP